ncbi:MAG: DUF4190 domain-containing protein [Verrucomicrobiales bacterium]
MDPNQIPQQGGKMSVLSLVSMILGIISIPLICCSFLDLPLAIGAIICGHLGVKDVANSDKTGGGMAKAGLIMGYISLVLALALGIFAAVSGEGGGSMDFQQIMEQIQNAQNGIEPGMEPTIDVAPSPDPAVPPVQ